MYNVVLSSILVYIRRYIHYYQMFIRLTQNFHVASEINMDYKISLRYLNVKCGVMV